MKQILQKALQVSRPISWFNTVFPFAAGAFLTNTPLSTRQNLAGMLYFTLPYNLALYGINDIFDYPSDRLNPRKNSLEGSLLPPEQHRAILLLIGATNLPLLVYFFRQHNKPASRTLVSLLLTTIVYSAPPLRAKEVPFVDALTSATHFVLPFIYGLSLNRAGTYPWLDIAAYTTWCMASQSFGAVQDIPFDRQVGSRSIATALGAGGTARFSTALYLLSGALVLAGKSAVGERRLAALALLPYPINTALFLRQPQPEQANRFWRRFIWLNLLTGAIYTNLFLWHRLQQRKKGKL